MPRKSSPSPKTPAKAATGASQAPKAVTPSASTPPAAKTATAASNSPSSPTPAHQTHGGYTPITGPIRSVRQLVRTPNVARGSIGSFPTLESYGTYIRGLSLAELHRHAIEEAHIVAIDDRTRLIKRLEDEWSAHASVESASSINGSVPVRPPFTDEQIARQEAIRKKLMGGRG